MIMTRARQVIAASLVMTFLAVQVSAQTTRGRRPRTPVSSGAQSEQLIRRIELGAERFRMSLDDERGRARDDSLGRADSAGREDVFDMLTDLERSIANLREHQERGQTRSINYDVEAALGSASRIDSFLQNNRPSARAERDWSALKADISQLARTYNVPWDPNRRDYPPYPPADDTSYNFDQDITGTYRLSRAGGDEARAAADRATRTLPSAERRRVYDQLVARLEAPEEIAIERRGNTVSLASSRAAQVTLDVNGREQMESTAGGRTVRARASFYGDRLTVSARGDQGNDFTVTFDPIDNGRRLQVTRRVSVEGLRDPVEVRSVYDRTADTARFDIYNPSRVPGRREEVGRTTSEWAIPSGTLITATLDQDLSTKTSREGDRFTMTVREPSQYDGAVIEGTISQAQSSGRVSGRSEMTFNLERIRMRGGRSYNFAGVVEGVRTAEGGGDVRVDNEGAVREGDSQTQKTVQRAAIGTAVGAIIGAIAGGGKGAAIGAVLGAGGGAGSVYVQGRDELELRRGTEVTIRTSGPSRGQ